jgi:hypothetical protein
MALRPTWVTRLTRKNFPQVFLLSATPHYILILTISRSTHTEDHDASKVPPSVLAAHVGEPEILHDGEPRSSGVSDQDKYLGSEGGL